MKKKIFLGLILLIVVIQFFRPDKNTATEAAATDFITLKQPPEEIASYLKVACYDCHSNNTRYPWYAEVAPVSWWIADHIEHAQHHLNLSEWGTYEPGEQAHKWEEMWEMLEEKEMPLESYTWLHGDALEGSEALLEWLESNP